MIGRIHNLFHSATNCFRGDQRLWLQYIDFTMRSRSGQAAGKVFAQALSFHPNFVPFWICAASWEYFTNANIHAARILLQRANRLNPHSQEILLEYCRLELAYREKVMQRLDIFGVGEEELKVSHIEMPSSSGSGATEGGVGAGVGDSSKGALEQIAAGDFNEQHDVQKKSTTKKGNSSNPFFSGAIPTAVFQAAISSFPRDLSLRIQFARIVASFYDTKNILDGIYNSIEKDFAEDAQAQAFIARRPFDSPPLPAPTTTTQKEEKSKKRKHNIDIFETTNACVSNFERELSSHPSTALYEQYITFLLQILDHVDPNYLSSAQDPNQDQEKLVSKDEDSLNTATTTFLRKKISLVCKEAFANGLLSERLGCNWIDFLLATDRMEDAIETGEKYSSALPSSPLVQTMFFSLVAQLREAHEEWKESSSNTTEKTSPSSSSPAPTSASTSTSTYSSSTFSSQKLKKYLGWTHDDMSTAISKALKKIDLENSASGDLFIMYWNYLIDSDSSVTSVDGEERNAEESIALAAAKNHYKRTLSTLHGASLQKFKRSTLISALSRWSDKSEMSVARVRALYQSGMDAPPTDFAYYRMCINFETSLGTPRSISLSRRLFEAAASDFGNEEKDVWLSYIEWETALGQHSNSSQLFTRAKRTLKNPDQFIIDYHRKMDEAFRESSSSSTASSSSSSSSSSNTMDV